MKQNVISDHSFTGRAMSHPEEDCFPIGKAWDLSPNWRLHYQAKDEPEGREEAASAQAASVAETEVAEKDKKTEEEEEETVDEEWMNRKRKKRKRREREHNKARELKKRWKKWLKSHSKRTQIPRSHQAQEG